MKEDLQVTGVVQLTAPVGEYDRRLVLLTRERGKLSVFAGGSRKPTSPLLAVCRPFVFAKFTLYEGRNSYRVKSAQIIEHFDEMAKNFDAVAYGSYFLELAGYYSEENLESGELLDLLYLSLKALLKPSLPMQLVRLVYEVRMLCLNGEAPEVFHCVACKKELSSGIFRVRAHGILCEDCAGKHEGERPLSQAGIYALQYMESAPLAKLYTFVLKEDVFGELRDCVSRYLQYYGGHHFHTLSMLPR